MKLSSFQSTRLHCLSSTSLIQVSASLAINHVTAASCLSILSISVQKHTKICSLLLSNITQFILNRHKVESGCTEHWECECYCINKITTQNPDWQIAVNSPWSQETSSVLSPNPQSILQNRNLSGFVVAVTQIRTLEIVTGEVLLEQFSALKLYINQLLLCRETKTQQKSEKEKAY